tara:strand:+ start:4634 stop:4948 length:315 start_codon:yes stop_codon:yes gene_type:complete
MISKFLKVSAMLVSFIFLTGFMPFISIIGPSFTAVSSGNMLKASAQFLFDQSVKKKTGKNSIMLVKEEIYKKKHQNQLNDELRQLVEKRVKMTRKIINQNKISQ